MSIGVIMLVHTALDRAAQVARHWAQAGCAVVIHVDRRVPDAPHDTFRRALSDLQTLGSRAATAANGARGGWSPRRWTRPG